MNFVFGIILMLGVNGELPKQGADAVGAVGSFRSVEACNDVGSQIMERTERQYPGAKLALICIDISKMPTHSTTKSPVSDL